MGLGEYLETEVTRQLALDFETPYQTLNRLTGELFQQVESNIEGNNPSEFYIKFDKIKSKIMEIKGFVDYIEK